MEENVPFTELLKNCEIGRVISVKKIYYTGQVFSVTTSYGKKYVLKEKKDMQKVNLEYRLMSILKALDLPVAVPKSNSRGEYCFEDNGKYYCLYPFLKGSAVIHFYTSDAEEQIKSFGSAMARLHLGLKRCGKIEEYPVLDIYDELFEESLPKIQQNSTDDEIRNVNRIAGELRVSLMPKIRGLPQQLIHKDMHPSNMLYEGGKGVVGLIDFDSVEFGNRLYDICYFCAYILLGGFKDDEKRLKWFKLVRIFIKSYDSVSEITKEELDAFWYVLLSTLFFFAGVFHSVWNTSTAKKTQNAICWVYENRKEIIKHILI